MTKLSTIIQSFLAAIIHFCQLNTIMQSDPCYCNE